MDKADTDTGTTSFIPGWAWLPLLLCALIPFTYPDPWPVAIGVVGAIASILIARQARWSESKCISLCVVTVMFSWMVAGGIVGGSATQQALSPQASTAPQVDLDDELVRRRIFAKAMWGMPSIDETLEDIREARSNGKSTDFYKKRLAMQEEAHAARQLNVAESYKLTSEQFERIVNEGVAEDWPQRLL